MTILLSVLPCELTLCSPPFASVDAPALVDCSGLCVVEPLGASPAPRYRRPRQCLRLSRAAPLLLRLAARGAMPSRPSLLPTIVEVDESLYLDACPNFLARSPSPFAAKCDESSRKRRTPEPEACSDPWSHMRLSACPVPVESLQAILTPDAMAHWKRLRGMPCPA